MLRLDALSLSSTALPSLTFDLHGLLLDDLHLRSPEQDFLCSDIANLPQGVGVATVTSSAVEYTHLDKVHVDERRREIEDHACDHGTYIDLHVHVATVMASISFDYRVYLCHYLTCSQDVSVSMTKLMLSWTTTAHRCLHHTASYLLDDFKMIKGKSCEPMSILHQINIQS